MTPTGKPAPPKLLLDTNVFRDLADGNLRMDEARLLRVAENKSPALLWISPMTFDEMAAHVRADEAGQFTHFRDALRWVDRLCGNLGVAEDLPWILRRGAFASAPLYDSRRLVGMNVARRELIKLDRFADVPPRLVDTVKRLRADLTQRIDAWNEGRRQMQALVRAQPESGEPGLDARLVVADAVLEISRKQAGAQSPDWGAFRSEDEQRREQRELAAFELSHLLNGQNPHGYNVDKHRGDYHDGWLLAYLAAGYHLVTSDARLRSALRLGGCEDPRVLDVGAGLDLAEAWLPAGSAP
jgi:hypothetical protein